MFKERTLEGDQTLLMDFLMGERPGLVAKSIFGGSLQTETDFDFQSVWKRVHTECLDMEIIPTNLNSISTQGRCLLIAYLALFAPSAFPPKLIDFPSNELESIVTRYSIHLYPWLSPEFKSISDLQTRLSNNKTGIVISIGTKQIQFAIHTITTLRKVLQCDIPIEIHYAGDNDLHPIFIDILQKLPNVKVVNLLTVFPKELMVIEGWSLKPFALLAASFQKVILMDADVLFLQNPVSIVSNSTIFSQYGQLFFHDRTFQKDHSDYSDWFKSIVPNHSQYASQLRFVNQLSYHEQESGVVALDKSNIGVLHALLMACALNSNAMRAETYQHMWGDKESFWISWELLRVPYKFAPAYAGAIGVKQGSRVCGSLLQVDETFSPLYWNGGMQRIKSTKLVDPMRFEYNRTYDLVKFEYLATDFDGQEEIWTFETEDTPFCLKPKNITRDARALNERERSMGKLYTSLFKKMTSVWVGDFVDAEFSDVGRL
ncbi:hypothetical protein HDU79_003653 [Rhizoclosmatium sp. JEL0117]|nr:hypothetical protein HDU79_003653 [Rhizoclosmatium sp. JEL0117]